MAKYFLSLIMKAKKKLELIGSGWKTIHLPMSGAPRSSSSVSVLIRVNVFFVSHHPLILILMSLSSNLISRCSLPPFKVVRHRFTSLVAVCRCLQDGLQGCFFSGLGIFLFILLKGRISQCILHSKSAQKHELPGLLMLHFQNERGNQNALKVWHQ